MASSTIQEILFENKESVPCGLYVQLMDQLLRDNKNEEKLYRINYIVSTTRGFFDGELFVIEPQIKNKTRIVNLKNLCPALIERAIKVTPFKPFSFHCDLDHFSTTGPTEIKITHQTMRAHIVKTPYSGHEILKYDDEYSSSDDEDNETNNNNNKIEKRIINIKLDIHARKIYYMLSCNQL